MDLILMQLAMENHLRGLHEQLPRARIPNSSRGRAERAIDATVARVRRARPCLRAQQQPPA